MIPFQLNSYYPTKYFKENNVDYVIYFLYRVEDSKEVLENLNKDFLKVNNLTKGGKELIISYFNMLDKNTYEKNVEDLDISSSRKQELINAFNGQQFFLNCLTECKDLNQYDNNFILMRSIAINHNCENEIPCFVTICTENEGYFITPYDKTKTFYSQYSAIHSILDESDYYWERIINSVEKTGFENVVRDIDKAYEIFTKGIDITRYVPFNRKNELIISNKKYMDIFTFSKNAKKIFANFIDENNKTFENTLEKILKCYLFSSNEYECIKQYLDDNSYGFLNRGLSLAKNYTSDVDYSVACWCIGRMLEIELNLGAIHIIREQLNIELGRYYNRVEFINNERKYAKIRRYYNKDGKPLDYNYAKKENRNLIEYPAIKESVNVLFSNRENDFQYIENIRNIAREKFGEGLYSIISEIISIRNNATHENNPLKKEDFDLMIDNLNKLIENKFFEKNYELKCFYKKLIRNS